MQFLRAQTFVNAMILFLFFANPAWSQEMGKEYLAPRTFNIVTDSDSVPVTVLTGDTYTIIGDHDPGWEGSYFVQIKREYMDTDATGHLISGPNGEVKTHERIVGNGYVSKDLVNDLLQGPKTGGLPTSTEPDDSKAPQESSPPVAAPKIKKHKPHKPRHTSPPPPVEPAPSPEEVMQQAGQLNTAVHPQTCSSLFTRFIDTGDPHYQSTEASREGRKEMRTISANCTLFNPQICQAMREAGYDPLQAKNKELFLAIKGIIQRESAYDKNSYRCEPFFNREGQPSGLPSYDEKLWQRFKANPVSSNYGDNVKKARAFEASYGPMQVLYATAMGTAAEKGLDFKGAPTDLFDLQTNLKYGLKELLMDVDGAAHHYGQSTGAGAFNDKRVMDMAIYDYNQGYNQPVVNHPYTDRKGVTHNRRAYLDNDPDGNPGVLPNIEFFKSNCPNLNTNPCGG